jgi:translation initiation factor 1 (eIF-1/SUI1)
LYEKLFGVAPEEQGDAETKEPQEQKKVKKVVIPSKKIVITTIERTKRKRITQIRGLELFGILR